MKQQHAHTDVRLARIEAILHKLEGSGEVRDMPDLPVPDGNAERKRATTPNFASVGQRQPAPQRLQKGRTNGSTATSLRGLRQVTKPPPSRGSKVSLPGEAIVEEREDIDTATPPPPTQPCETAIAARQPAGGVVQPVPTAPSVVPAGPPSEGVGQPAPTVGSDHGSSLHARVAPPPIPVVESSSSESDSDELVIAWRPDAVNAPRPDGYDVAVPALKLPRLGLATGRPASALSLR